MRNLFLIVVLVGLVLCQSVKAEITLTDLGSLGGGGTIPYALNNKGEVVGVSKNTAGNDRAFLWRAGVMTDLGTLGGMSATAFGINDKSQIVGQADDTSGNPQAFLWDAGAMVDLDHFNTGPSVARAININGEVVGDISGKAFRHDGDIFLLPLNEPSHVYGINKFGVIVGYEGDVVRRPIIHDHGLTTRLGFQGEALAINDNGFVVGRTNTDIFIYRNGISSGIIVGNNFPLIGLNETNVLVGSDGAQGPFVWYDSHYSLLSNLVPNIDVKFKMVTDINDVGQVTLVGSDGHGYLMSGISVPEPSTLGLLAVSALLVSRRRSR